MWWISHQTIRGVRICIFNVECHYLFLEVPMLAPWCLWIQLMKIVQYAVFPWCANPYFQSLLSLQILPISLTVELHCLYLIFNHLYFMLKLFNYRFWNIDLSGMGAPPLALPLESVFKPVRLQFFSAQHSAVKKNLKSSISELISSLYIKDFNSNSAWEAWVLETRKNDRKEDRKHSICFYSTGYINILRWWKRDLWYPFLNESNTKAWSECCLTVLEKLKDQVLGLKLVHIFGRFMI